MHKEKNNYLVPLVHCVPKVIEHLRYHVTQGVLVVPYWPSAVFWPLIIQSPKVFCSWVKDARLFSNPLNGVQQGRNEGCFIGSSGFRSPILALKLSFVSEP